MKITSVTKVFDPQKEALYAVVYASGTIRVYHGNPPPATVQQFIIKAARCRTYKASLNQFCYKYCN